MKLTIICSCDYEDYYCTEEFEHLGTDWFELADYLNYLETKVGKILEIKGEDY